MRIITNETWKKLEEIQKAAEQHYEGWHQRTNNLSRDYVTGELETVNYIMNILRSECKEIDEETRM